MSFPVLRELLKYQHLLGIPRVKVKVWLGNEVLFLNVLRQFVVASIDDLFDLFYEN